MRGKAGTEPGAGPRAKARGEPAGYAGPIRGGRSGPLGAKLSTLGTTAENTAQANTGVGTYSTALRIAPPAQHEAQALHLCVLASPTLSVA